MSVENVQAERGSLNAAYEAYKQRIWATSGLFIDYEQKERLITAVERLGDGLQAIAAMALAAQMPEEPQEQKMQFRTHNEAAGKV